MSGKKQAGAAGGKSIVVIAGEGQNDRDVLRHLVPALRCWPATKRPKIVEIGKPMRLNKAQYQLEPRVDELRRLAQAQAKRAQARLVGVVVHVDLDHVIDDRYEARRKQLTKALHEAFDCDTALALAADEMEAWLMLFPGAFPKTNAAWRLSGVDLKRDLGLIAGGAKERLKSQLKQPQYEERDAPEVMRRAVENKLVTTCDRNRNRSYADFAAELDQWK
ncbi:MULTISPECIES: hypothetical protein [Streptomyces]|uniref:hypothetical protein n=1 Tax=Streptomyces TaxID=1883 RepID=UPI00293044A2|nr:hypothetical protein [Streptomyces sp. NEAU-HV9]